MENLGTQLQQTIDALQEELQVATRALLSRKRGLKDSDVVKSLQVEYSDNAFALVTLDYLQYLATGRRPRARKVPIEALLKWIKEKNIPTRGGITSTAYAIQQSIYKSGIKAKFSYDEVIDTNTEIISTTLAEDLSQYIVDDLVDAIEQK
jgi:hypothetical protein